MLLIDQAVVPTAAERQGAERSLEKQNSTGDCFDLIGQLPAGANATISGGDWSGVGTVRIAIQMPTSF